jgi:thioredoxin reductase
MKDEHGRLLVDADQMTNLPGVFAGGSIVYGSVPLVEVVQGAQRASRAIDSYLIARRMAQSL